MFYSALLTSCYVRTLLHATAEFPTWKTRLDAAAPLSEWLAAASAAAATSAAPATATAAAKTTKSNKELAEGTKLWPLPELCALGLECFMQLGLPRGNEWDEDLDKDNSTSGSFKGERSGRESPLLLLWDCGTRPPAVVTVFM